MVRLGLGHDEGAEYWRAEKEEVGVGVAGREGVKRQRNFGDLPPRFSSISGGWGTG